MGNSFSLRRAPASRLGVTQFFAFLQQDLALKGLQCDSPGWCFRNEVPGSDVIHITSVPGSSVGNGDVKALSGEYGTYATRCPALICLNSMSSCQPFPLA